MPVSLSPALALCLDLLCCPTCGTGELHAESGALRCPRRHSFDIARHGYVSLLTGARATSGDDAPMVQARDRFLAGGAYGPLREAVARLAAESAPEGAAVVDVGCGTGYYLAHVLAQLPAGRGLGLDTSVRALRMAARVHERAAAVACDAFRPLPLGDAVADVILNVFAPRNPPEFHRALRSTGRLIVARPTERHLTELRERLPAMITIDPAKEQRLHETLDPYFQTVETERIEYRVCLSTTDALDLVAMSPSARHVGSADLEAGGDLPGQVTVSVLATAYRPR